MISKRIFSAFVITSVTMILIAAPGARSSPSALAQFCGSPLVGFADLHAHQFAHLGFGGKAFVGAAFGPIDHALPHCDYLPGTSDWVHGPGGIRDLLGQAVAMSPLPGHRVGGYPEFDGWPRWNLLTHQMMFEDWLLRAYRGGLRLIVMLAVNNEFACNLVETLPGRTCNDMEAVDLQIEAAKAMERYIDSKSAGPGTGWYRIVYSARQARDVINAGKMAVVLGAEVDFLFNCKLENQSCTEDHVRRELERYYQKGLRHLFPIHFNTNKFGGAALSNPLTTAENVRDCYDEGYRYRHPRYAPLPLVGPRATCNADGLTELGKFLIREMIGKRMIIDTDHMSALAVNDALTIAEQFDYPVVSGHTGFIDISNGDKRHEGNRTQSQVERIRRLGGMLGLILNQGNLDQTITWRGAGQPVVEHQCGSTTEIWAQAYLYAAQQMQGGPVAFGTDFNGLAHLPGPRFGDERCPGGKGDQLPTRRLAYPFRVLATGGLMGRNIVGRKTFDINEDGVPHVGMLPDMVADLEQQFGFRSEVLNPLLKSAEGYVKMWEKIEALQRLP